MTNEPFSLPALQFLDALGIPYRLYRHNTPTKSMPVRATTLPVWATSLEQVAAERSQRPEQVVRSILFRLAKERYGMALISGPEQISWPALRKIVGQSRLTLASPEEVLQVTGYRIGAVTPLGLPVEMPVLADERIFALEEISLGSGERGLALILRSADLRRALPGMQIVNLLA
ncbi:MAG TPA: YbaK/EbsC family protein [Anaerolineaceae bacterium]|nr:YbaK/EbsC family protein [Anaerolineaceae bacterium]